VDVVGAARRRVLDHNGRPLHAEVDRAPVLSRPAPCEVRLADLVFDRRRDWLQRACCGLARPWVSPAT
jgi:hypothetical protein